MTIGVMCNGNEMQLMYWAALNNWSIMGLDFSDPIKLYLDTLDIWVQ